MVAPAFGRPTWSIIVVYGLNSKLPVPGLVLTGALAAASVRLLLAHLFRLLSNYVPHRMKRNVAAARKALARKRRNAVIALGLFALSPFPSAQLFEAAGLSKVPLLGFTAAFFVGRIISYSIYALTAKGIAQSTIGDTFQQGMTSPIGIGIELLMIALLIVFTQVDWKKHLS